MISFILCFITIAIGCTIQVICGFGLGVFSMMILPYILPSTTGSGALVNILTFIQAIWICIKLRNKIRWKEIWIPLLSYLIISFISVNFAKELSNDTLKMILGALLLILSLYFILIVKNLRIKPSVPAGIIAGGLGGVLSGLFSVGGPPVSLYYSSVLDEKEEYLATITSYFLISNAYIITVKAYSGFITKEILIYTCISIVAMILGTFIGNKIFNKINPAIMKKSIYILMAVSGIIMLVQSIL